MFNKPLNPYGLETKCSYDLYCWYRQIFTSIIKWLSQLIILAKKTNIFSCISVGNKIDN